MDQPEHLNLRPFQATHSTPRRLFSFALVGLFHVAVIYAFASGLAGNLVNKVEKELKIEKVQNDVVKQLPPPPPPDLAHPPPPFVPPPTFTVTTEAPVTNTITVQHDIPQVAPPPPKPAGISAPALISGGAKCQSSYYPPIAIRLNQEGTTVVAVHVNADGSVGGADVVTSSGHDSLDEAAVKCVSNAWHFKPAMQNGEPVATTKQYAIKWVLQ